MRTKTLAMRAGAIAVLLALALGLASAQTTIYNIDQMSGWYSCDACAGAGGTGSTNTHWMKQNIASPSLDGRSAQFFLGGSTPYSNALWWKPLTAQPAAHHFVYDLWFYLKNATAPQALEFDVNQAVNGFWYIFGTECSMKSTKTWQVWDYNLHWVNTGISCMGFSAYTWHHLIWELERTTSGKTHFISFTLDGVKHYVNHYHTPKSSSSSKLTVAFQMDGNKYMTDYSVWLDKIKLTYW